jgi:hypothetical protein
MNPKTFHRLEFGTNLHLSRVVRSARHPAKKSVAMLTRKAAKQKAVVSGQWSVVS